MEIFIDVDKFKNAYKCLDNVNNVLESNFCDFNELDESALVLVGKEDYKKNDILNNIVNDCYELKDKMYKTMEILSQLDVYHAELFDDVLKDKDYCEIDPNLDFGPPDSYTVPPDSYTVPSDSYTVPSDSYTVPPDSYMVPSDSYMVPSDSYTVPADSYMVSSDTYTVPADSYMVSSDTYTVPADSYTVPADPYTVPSDPAPIGVSVTKK